MLQREIEPLLTRQVGRPSNIPVVWYASFLYQAQSWDRARSGQQWRVNFYKCGNKTSHPHYGAWAPVDVPDFHMLRCFGALEFGK